MDKLQLFISDFQLQAAVSKSEFPFMALVTYGNSISDYYVGGTENIPGGPYRVMVPADVLKKHMPSLEGKPTFARADFDSHSDTKEIGEFVHTWTEPVLKENDGSMALAGKASGIFHRDSDQELVDATINKARAGVLGFSYDIEAHQFEFETIEGGEKIIRLTRFSWNGATVLFRNAAAYRSTQLAAMKLERERKEDTMDESKVTEMLDAAIESAVEKLTTALTAKIDESATTFATKIGEATEGLKTEIMTEISKDLSEVKASIESMKKVGDGGAGGDGDADGDDAAEISVENIAEAVFSKVKEQLTVVSKDLETKFAAQIEKIPVHGQRKSKSPHFTGKYGDGDDGKKLNLKSGSIPIPESKEEYEELKGEIQKSPDLSKSGKTALLAKLLPYKRDLYVS